MNVTIGIPYYDSIAPEMFYSMLAALNPEHTFRYTLVGGPLIAQNREAIVSDAIAAGSERMVFVDSDIAFPSDAIGRLLAHSYPIIGGMYHLKHFPLESAMKLPAADSATEFFTGRVTLPNHPLQAALLPAGFLSLHLPSLERLPRPWFTYGYENGSIIGEDVMFCRIARAAGFELWCDPTIPLKHIGRMAF